ncbi:tetratricopeptide repeat protein [Erythrobacter litoralis]|uniref:tetratricopeptide repeat protein n=1 Tax=Erythrobacter litoralis TaxID=39960 RepID=UPI00243482AD|nr:tetratricopeptide repeat protein [Erythrobacter litoralis]MDG6078950.1 tetratricopeptide repeat protein [Erythrobacter litoralis]
MEDKELRQPPFVGESRRLVVDGLLEILEEVQYHERAAWVSIEAPSGWGKTRVAHAFYERLAARQETEYWPSTILEATDASFLDVASRRKRVFPEPHAIDRVSGSLPEFFWWGIACDLRNGVPAEALHQDLGQIEAHSLYLEAASAALINSERKSSLTLERARKVASALVEEAAGEGLGRLSELLLGSALPGMGLMVDLAKLGFGQARDRQERREAVAEAGMALEAADDDVSNTTALLRRLARPGLPIIVFVEDIHRDDGLVSELVSNLVRSNAAIMLISTTWPGEIERSSFLSSLTRAEELGSDRIFRLKHDQPLPAIFPAGASMDELPSAALKQLILSYFHNTEAAVLNGLANRYNNPLPIEIICTLPKHQRGAREGKLVLSAEEIERLPRKVEDLYRELWDEIPYAAQCLLALSTLAIPTGSAEWNSALVSEAIETVSESLFGNEGDDATGDTDEALNGWVRDLHNWMRRFNEPDQMAIARSELDSEELFGRETILPFLENLASALAKKDLNCEGEIASEQQYQAWLVINLRSKGLLDNDILVDAVLLLMRAMANSPRALPNRLELFGWFWNRLQKESEEAEVTDEAGESNEDEEEAKTLQKKFFMILELAANASAQAGRVAQAIPTFELLLSERQDAHGKDHADVLRTRDQIAAWTGYAGRAAEALEQHRTLLEDRRRILGEGHPDILASRNNVAFWLGETGRLGEALEAQRALLDDRRRMLGKDHPDVLTTRNNIAHLLGAMGRVEQAIEAFRELLTDRARILGEEHPLTLLTRNNLATWLGEGGRIAEALEAHQELLKDRQRLLGEDHPHVLSTRGNIANWIKETGRVEKALDAQRELLKDRIRILGQDHPDVLASRNSIATWLGDSGRIDEAIEAHRAVLEDRCRVQGADDPTTLNSRHNVAHWIGRIGRCEQALEAFQDLLIDRQRVFGDAHPDTLRTRNEIGHWLSQCGRLEEALAVHSKLLADRISILGEDHPATMLTRSNFAYCLYRTGRIDEALTAHRTLLEDRRRVFGDDHPDVLLTRNEIAVCLGDLGRIDEALVAHEAVLADRKRIHDKNNPSILQSRISIAALLGKLGRHEGAIEAHQAVLEDRLRVLGEEHADTLQSRSNLAAVLANAGKFDNALAAHRELLKDRQRILGEDHPDTLQTRSNIAAVLAYAGHLDEAEAAFVQLLDDQMQLLGAEHPAVLKTRQNLEAARNLRTE